MESRLKRWLFYKGDEAVAKIKRRLPEPARRWIKRSLRLRDSIVSQAFSNAQMSTLQLQDEYHRLVAGNVTNVLLNIVSRFYRDLGVVDVHSVPLVKALESFRATLPASEVDVDQARQAPVLIRFERAFALSEAGRVNEALPLFELVFRDRTARKVAAYDPFAREAVVRSGEFLGRYHDKRGEVDASIAIYREIMSIEQDGLIARRLMLLLSRRGDLSEAAEFGEAAMLSKLNLFPRLPEKNPYIEALEREFLAK
jgi:tetratricopeptide (TPR) repeat protein